MQDKIALLLDRSERLLAGDGVAHTTAGLFQVKENKFYADTAGTVTTQQRVRLEPSLTATAVDSATGRLRDDVQPDARRSAAGYEYLTDGTWDFDAEIRAMGEQLAEKVKAPSIEPGRYDLVIDPTNLWLTIHESIGHATEYDRAIGYEAAYAGTSFATPDQLGTLVYGSPIMNVTGDRTVAARAGHHRLRRRRGRRPVLEPGHAAAFSPATSSTGCSPGGSAWTGRTAARTPTRPAHVPIQRMANVSLQPDPDGGSTADLIAGIDDGIYVVGDKSWSIDMQRYNFQFTGQRFYRIRDGRAGRPGPGRRLPGDHDRLLGRDGRGRRSADLPAGRRLQLRQGPARSGRGRVARLPGRPIPRHLDPQHRPGG